LPVGISFLVFRMLTYVIDIYRGQLAPAPALDFAVYTAFFPYLLAGPIARAREFLPQLNSPRDPHTVDSSRAFVLILGGLVKKMLIADYLSTHIVNGLFASPQTYSSWETLWGIVAYSVQIYCDFSAYADIAIGVSLLLGFELPDNFDAPYTARTIQDFWRRWHITLSSWLRDYLYIPLGGTARGGVAPTPTS
jgi:D-alanyl-lipoteichoic acid acyltransferase DltB (MBOAT superfamily)